MQNNIPVILSGLEARRELSKTLQERVRKLGHAPVLAIVLIGDDSASVTYVRNKKKFGESIGCTVKTIFLPSTISQTDAELVVSELDQDPTIDGIIVQHPVPQHLVFTQIVNRVRPTKDVDGLKKDSESISATARGILSLLRFYHIDIVGKHVVVVGRSHMVGLATGLLLLQQDATVTFCHSKTINLKLYTSQADILVVASGKQGLITKECVRPNQIIIDVGIHKTEKGIVGDVDIHSVGEGIQAISPVPGGVGPMTVYALFENLVDTVERHAM